MPKDRFEIKKYGAIDIGSNAIRLLISNVILQEDKAPKFKKNALIRIPIRLGLDAFHNEKISKQNIDHLTDAMKAFKLLMKIHGVEKYMACATSAMRCASNGSKIAKKIQKETSIDIQIIDGKKEAAIIAATDVSKLIERHTNYLYVDVGGGSTECSVIKENQILNSKSFKIGTVRLLGDNKIDKTIWEQMKLWIVEHTKNIKKLVLVGSGGNINKFFKLSGQETGKPLSSGYVNAQYKHLKNMSYEQLICDLELNEDRADVIISATKIYVAAMKWSDIKKIYVPKLGLADGMIKLLFKENIQNE